MINVTIDGKMLQVDENQTILDACKQNAIHIPTLCYLEKINMIGSCRLCVVEIEGLNKLVTSCNTNVKEGMVIKTHTERVEEARKNTLHLLMAEHKTNCFKCVKMVPVNCKMHRGSMEWMCQTSNHLIMMFSMPHLMLIHFCPMIQVFASNAKDASVLVQVQLVGMPFRWKEMQPECM